MCCVIFLYKFILSLLFNGISSTYFSYRLADLISFKLNCFAYKYHPCFFSPQDVIKLQTESLKRSRMTWVLLQSMLPKFPLYFFLKFCSFLLTKNSSRFSFLKLIHKHWKYMGDWWSLISPMEEKTNLKQQYWWLVWKSQSEHAAVDVLSAEKSRCSLQGEGSQLQRARTCTI